MTPAQYTALLAAPLNAAFWRNVDVTPAQYNGLLAAIQAAGMAIGAAVSGGTAGRVLLVGAGPVLAQDAGLTFVAGSGLSASSGAFVGTLGKSVYGGQFADGTHTVRIADGTNNILYGAATPTSWAGGAPPTDVWVGLDRCAAALNTLLTPP